MEVAHEKLLKEFEDFEEHLQVESILEKVKAEWVLEDKSLGEFAESLKQLEPEKVEAQRRRAPTVLPPIDLRLVRRGARLLL